MAAGCLQGTEAEKDRHYQGTMPCNLYTNLFRNTAQK